MNYTGFVDYYDKIYDSQGKDYGSEVRRLHGLVQRLKLTTGRRLLDVGCGTGVHLRHMKAFFEVGGLDSSGEMLRVTSKKLPGIPLHRADMRDFSLDRAFDVITCLFGSIGFVESVRGLGKAVGNMSRHLAWAVFFSFSLCWGRRTWEMEGCI